MKKVQSIKTKSIITKKGHGIFLDSIQKDELELLKKLLTVKPVVLTDYDFGEDSSFPVYRLSDTRIYIPKFYGLNKYGPTDIKIKDGVDANLNFNGQLKDHQVDFCNRILKELNTKNSCIAVSQTGSGKTCVALWLAAQLKKRTLIIVHKEFLMNQWVERIKQFLPDASIGIIQQNRCQSDKDIIIAMIQSINSREYPEGTFDNHHLVIYDECFPYKQMVITSIGQLEIGFLYNMWNYNSNNLPLILSFNEINNTTEFKKITYAWKKTNYSLLKIYYGKGSIKCTENHKILTNNGYKEAIQLKIGDLIKCNYVQKNETYNLVAQNLNEDQYQIMIGSFLGDGHIYILPSNRYRLNVIHSEKQKNYCEWKAHMFNSTISKIENNGYSKGIAYNFTTKIFDLLDTFPKTKHTCPQWLLDKLDFRGLAIWWMDDGCLSKTSFSGVLSTCSFDEESHIRITKKLQTMGIDCKYKEDGHGYLSIYINKNGILELIKNIRQYMHPNMKYKFYNDKLNIDEIIPYVWNTKLDDFGTVRIQKIEKCYNSSKYVYDLEIEDNHNFILATGKQANCGPIVHNCHHLAAKGFSQTFFKIGSKMTLGLSATPKRADGLTKVLEWFLGSIIKNEIVSEIEVPMVKFIECQYSTKIVPKFNFKGNLNAPNMINQLVADPTRNEQIVDEIMTLNNEGRKILVLSGRRGQCEVLNKLVCERKKKSTTTGMYLGGMKNADLDISNKADIIFATYAMASEAYDNIDLDTLIMATGLSNIVQAVGRILRKKNKFRPLVVDFTDTEYFGGQASRRKQYYKKSGYQFPGLKTYEKEPENDECLFD
jgi:superfamily II DNA or RNA helicase